MVDTANKKAWARIKIYGSKMIAEIEADSIQKCLLQIGAHIHKFRGEWRGVITIEISPTPLDAHVSEQEKSLKELYAGIDMSLVIPYAEIDEETRKKMEESLEIQSRDPLLVEYRGMVNPKNIERSTPERLQFLKRHMEENYSNTEHWNGVHLF